MNIINRHNNELLEEIAQLKARVAELENIQPAYRQVQEQRNILAEREQAIRAEFEHERQQRQLYKNWFQAVHEMTLDGFTILGCVRDAGNKVVDYNWLYNNPTAEKLMGKTLDDLKGHTVVELYPTSISSGLFDIYQQVMETGLPYETELRYNGEGIDGWFRSVTVRVENGVAISYSDITERKLAQEQLNFQANVLSQLYDAVIAVDNEQRITYWNGGAERLYQYSAEEVIGELVQDVTKYAWVNSELEKSGTWRGEVFHHKKDGTRIFIEAAISVLKNEQSEIIGLLAINRDITARKQIEQELRDSRELYRNLTEAIPQLIWMTDETGQTTYLNERWYEYSGLNAEQLNGQNWPNLLYPDDHALTFQKWVEAFKAGQNFLSEYRLRAADGSYRWFLVRARPIHNAQGQITNWFGTSTDINDQKQALETQKELDYLKDLFVSVAGHELRNPLTSLKGYAQFLQMNLLKQAKAPQTSLDTDKFLRSAEQIVRQADRMEDLITQLLDFSRIQNQKLELNYSRQADLVELVNQVVEQQRTTHPNYSIIFQPPSEPIKLNFDVNRLEQVLDNLISNAAKYSPENTGIKIRIESPSAEKPCEVIVWVQDEGYGISEEHQAHIFDRFYRERTSETKKIDGLGLGLYVSNEIIRQHGGRMWLTSEPGKGSTFFFALPLASADD